MVMYKTGQTVRYKPVGGPTSNTSESVGKIMDVLTEPGQQAGRNVNASPETPRYEVCRVVNLNTGKSTTIYEANILGISR
ncbi:hypothetical protein SMACR_12085 [Sordaria macrospora]|uniref:Hypervirulence associated protein TUDOR domain-containing protein n=1 Tax=Sordaria macrospora TaxID=5147 RepID=A0A8S8ZD80_SORMA|nr:hypothetical protein SMACR_12085 [Sordaria macrospora]WPJ64028.1 hypothetical protein SMAC4_12085 [Sordaria macrospora]